MRLLALLAALCFPIAAHASRNGIFGHSGNPEPRLGGGATCTECHGGGSAPTVTLSGPQTLAPGAVGDYTLTISGGQQKGGGFDVSTTNGKLLAVGTGEKAKPTSCDALVEVTHTSPAQADSSGNVTFDFQLQAPADTDRTLRIFAAGNSVNLDGTNQGDQPALATLDVSIGAGSPIVQDTCPAADAGAQGGDAYDTDGGCLLCSPIPPPPKGGCGTPGAGVIALLGLTLALAPTGLLRRSRGSAPPRG